MSTQLDQKTDEQRYQVCGLNLVSDVPLPELLRLPTRLTTTEPDLRIRLLGPIGARPIPHTWLMSTTLPTGEPWLCTAKVPGGYFLRFPQLADFFVDAAGQRIDCLDSATPPDETARHLLLDQVLPLALTLRCRTALHATAVQTPFGACAFMGSAGAGKSTLAASFLLAGYPALSDDCLALEEEDAQILAIPAYPGLRLWDDVLETFDIDQHQSQPVAHYTSKRRPILEERMRTFPETPQPLARLYSLVWMAEENRDCLAAPRIEPLSRQAGFMELLQFTFLLDPTDQTMLTRQFHFLSGVASRVPIRRLHLPNSFSALPAVREAILADLRNG